MLPSVGRSILRSRMGRGGLALAAAVFMLAALFASTAMTPRASAQSCCWPWQTSFTGYGGYGGYGGWGYGSLFGNYGYGLGGYGGYGGFGYGLGSYGGSGYGLGGYGYGLGGYGGYGASYGYGGYGSSPFSYGYGYSPIYASPGLGTAYTLPYGSAYPINPSGQPISSPPQQYPFATTIISGYLGYQAYAISGMYCTDKSGGQVYVNAGTAVPSGVTCNGPTRSGNSTTMPASSGSPY